MRFVVYRLEDGKILRTGTASSRSLMRLKAKPGEAVLEGMANTREDMVVDGQIVRRPSE